MKIFISSLIGGMELFRAAARSAVESLGLEPVMAEDFGARPHSPQIACLDGLRQSVATVLILGANYGALQSSGLSATHEEYHEARERMPVLAFVQEGVDREPSEAAMVDEVQGWSTGLFRSSFRTPEELQAKIIRGLHEWQLANAAGPVDNASLIDAALALMPEDRRSQSRSVGVLLTIAAGPSQAILRPSEIEASSLRDALLQAAMFGPLKIFEVERGSKHRIAGHALELLQEDHAEMHLEPTGAIRIRLPIPQSREGMGQMVVVEENVAATLRQALAYTAALLERIDSTHRLTHIALAVTLDGANHMSWRTPTQHARGPNSMSMRGWGNYPKPVTLSPPVRPRAALATERDRMVEDLVTLLRREWQSE